MTTYVQMLSAVEIKNRFKNLDSFHGKRAISFRNETATTYGCSLLDSFYQLTNLRRGLLSTTSTFLSSSQFNMPLSWFWTRLTRRRTGENLHRVLLFVQGILDLANIVFDTFHDILQLPMLVCIHVRRRWTGTIDIQTRLRLLPLINQSCAWLTGGLRGNELLLIIADCLLQMLQHLVQTLLHVDIFCRLWRLLHHDTIRIFVYYGHNLILGRWHARIVVVTTCFIVGNYFELVSWIRSDTREL
jgi:hypothetical protein